MSYQIQTTAGTFIVSGTYFGVEDGVLFIHDGEKIVAMFKEWIGVQERKVEIENKG